MRTQGPLHEGHLAEAVRRGLLTVDQVEAVLALARSEASPGAAHVPDLRWAAVVLGLAAAVAVLVPGVTLLAQMRTLTEASLMGACALAVVACGALGWLARRRGWGRAPASILTAGMAPYAGGLAMFALDAAWHGMLGVNGRDGDLAGQFSRAQADRVIGALFLAAALASTAVVVALWRRRRNGPAWSMAGACVPLVALVALVTAVTATPAPDASSVPDYAVAVAISAAVLGFVATARWWRPRLQRGGVDGAAWFELGMLAPGALSLAVHLYDSPDSLTTCLAAPLAAGLAGLWGRRWTFQLAGALGCLGVLALGTRHEPAPTRAAALVAAALVIAAVAQWQRRRETRLAAHEPAREALSYWE